MFTTPALSICTATCLGVSSFAAGLVAGAGNVGAVSDGFGFDGPEAALGFGESVAARQDEEELLVPG